MDRRILSAVQREGGLSAAELGDRIGLSAMPAWRRLRKLVDEGVICATVSLLDRRKVGLTVTAFVMLRTNRHDAEWFAKLAAFVQREQAVTEFHRMSGEIDFMLKVLLRDLDDYRNFYNRLTVSIDLMDVSTSFAFETLKETTTVPL